MKVVDTRTRPKASIARVAEDQLVARYLASREHYSTVPLQFDSQQLVDRILRTISETATAGRALAQREENRIYCWYEGWLPDEEERPTAQWEHAWIDSNLLRNTYPATTVAQNPPLAISLIPRFNIHHQDVTNIPKHPTREVVPPSHHQQKCGGPKQRRCLTRQYAQTQTHRNEKETAPKHNSTRQMQSKMTHKAVIPSCTHTNFGLAASPCLAASSAATPRTGFYPQADHVR